MWGSSFWCQWTGAVATTWHFGQIPCPVGHLHVYPPVFGLCWAYLPLLSARKLQSIFLVRHLCFLWFLDNLPYSPTTPCLTHQSLLIFFSFVHPLLKEEYFKRLSTVMDWSIGKFILNTGEKIESHDCVLSKTITNNLNYFFKMCSDVYCVFAFILGVFLMIFYRNLSLHVFTSKKKHLYFNCLLKMSNNL